MVSGEQVEEPIVPGHEDPAGRRRVHDWIAGRVAADAQMRAAAAARRARQQADEEDS